TWEATRATSAASIRKAARCSNACRCPKAWASAGSNPTAPSCSIAAAGRAAECVRCVGRKQREPSSSGRSHAFAGQLARLLHPFGELRLVELAFADVQVAHLLVLRLAGRNGLQRGAAKECHLDVMREAVEGEEPTF